MVQWLRSPLRSIQHLPWLNSTFFLFPIENINNKGTQNSKASLIIFECSQIGCFKSLARKIVIKGFINYNELFIKVKTADELKSFLLKPESVKLIIRDLDHVLTWTEYGNDKRASVHVF